MQQAETRAQRLDSKVEVSAQSKWSSMHGSWAPQNGDGNGVGCDDCEICLELELTKGLPQGCTGHPTGKLVFLIRPTSLSR